MSTQAQIAARIYLNGEFVDQSRACVSVFDRGLLFGDGVYEVVPAYGGRLFRPQQHLARLDRSLAAIRMANPMEHAAWIEVLQHLTEQLGHADQALYLQVTRGAYPVRSHAIPRQVEPTVFAFTYALPDPDPQIASAGVTAITLDDIRWRRCDIKAVTLLANVLAHSQARDEQADEAILVRDGRAIEGTASNLFIVNQGLLITPPNSDYLLPGVTRDLVLELAREHGLPYAEAEIGVAELAGADEVWLTSSTREIMPVTRLNGQPVGDGVPGPAWQQMTALFAACKVQLRTAGECHV